MVGKEHCVHPLLALPEILLPTAIRSKPQGLLTVSSSAPVARSIVDIQQIVVE